MCCLLPTHPAPLRPSILTSISLFSTRVYVHDQTLQPMPVAAHIDGHFDLVIALAENSIRLPLIGRARVSEQPPALRFRAKDEDTQRKLAHHVFVTAPEKGRETQLNTFVAILNSGKPLGDFVASFANALISFDLSFATAVCALASKGCELVISRLLFRLLVRNKMIDHFLRCTAVEVGNAVGGYEVQPRPELYAIVNLFIAQAAAWIVHHRPYYDVQSIPALLSRIGRDLQAHQLSEEAYYILRAVLTITAYMGVNAAIMAFLEIVVRPLVPLELIEDFDEARRAILFRDPDIQEPPDPVLRALVADIQRAITIALTEDSQVQVTDDDLSEEKFRILQFVCAQEKLEPFVKLVMELNAKKKKEHPIVQMMTFVYRKGIELGKHTQMGQEDIMRTLTRAATTGRPSLV
jgi:hypothetical protein